MHGCSSFPGIYVVSPVSNSSSAGCISCVESQLGMIEELFSDNVLEVGFILIGKQIYIGTYVLVLLKMPTEVLSVTR